MASGTPVVAAPVLALREVADGLVVYAEDGDFGVATRGLADRDRCGRRIERADASAAETARRTVEIYRRVLA
jgi:glycosyltransferase involved in cell wall biosynthesis